MGTGLHVVENEIKVLIIFGFDDVEQPDNVLVAWVNTDVPLSSCRNITSRKVRCASVAL